MGNPFYWGNRSRRYGQSTETRKQDKSTGLTDEWFLETTSENIKFAFEVKRAHGQYIGAYALYGYKKDPEDKNHLLIDTDVAENIQLIYDLYESGMGTGKIANYLNEKGIDSPAKYKRKLGFHIPSKYKAEIWFDTTILKILKNQMYIGNMVQGYSKKVSYKVNKYIPVKPEERIIVPNTHEGIITKEQFHHVQELLKSRRITGQGTPHPNIFAGKLRCKDCRICDV